jgi:HlyD family secretion protein
VVKELREVQSKRAELTERKITADDQLRRVDLRAPQSGIVHQLSVHTVGGVIEAGEQIMTIVPQGEQLVVEAKVAPRDIDQVRVDHIVNIRFPAFDMRTTPEFEGRVSRISADLTRDDASAPSYYVARIVLNQEKLRSTQGLKLVPGMPAEVQIATADRTAMSYLMKPIEDQVARAFKER